MKSFLALLMTTTILTSSCLAEELFKKAADLAPGDPQWSDQLGQFQRSLDGSGHWAINSIGMNLPVQVGCLRSLYFARAQGSIHKEQ